MGIALDQKTPIALDTGGGTTTYTFSPNPAVRSKLFVLLAMTLSSASDATFTVTDNGGNTYHKSSSEFVQGNWLTYQIYYADLIALPGSGSLTVTANPNSGVYQTIGQALAYKGVATGDAFSSTSNRVATTINTASVSTSGAGNLVLVHCGIADSATETLSYACTNGTIEGQVTSTAADSGFFADNANAASSSQSITATISGSTGLYELDLLLTSFLPAVAVAPILTQGPHRGPAIRSSSRRYFTPGIGSAVYTTPATVTASAWTNN
jgi:hypothetical protein